MGRGDQEDEELEGPRSGLCDGLLVEDAGENVRNTDGADVESHVERGENSRMAGEGRDCSDPKRGVHGETGAVPAHHLPKHNIQAIHGRAHWQPSSPGTWRNTISFPVNRKR